MRKNILYAVTLGLLLGAPNFSAFSQDVLPGNTQFHQLNQQTPFNEEQVNALLHELSQGVYKQADWVQTKISEVDKVGMVHYTYQLYYQNIPVMHHVYKVHVKNNQIQSISGEVSGFAISASGFSIAENGGLQSALAHINAQSYMWENAQAEAQIKREQHDAQASFYPHGEKVYMAHGNALVPVWKYDIYAEAPLSRDYVFVSANSGKVIGTSPRIHHANVTGTAITKYSGSQTIHTESLPNGTFVLEDSSRGNGIATWDLNNATNFGSAVSFVDNDNFWNNINAQQDEVATDAHWGAIMTYDYLLNEHGRNSIDGVGFSLNCYVHYSSNFANAFWDGQRMTFGDGNASMSALTTMDITGHEIAHGLTENSADLIYSYESGALNESFSDIFGAAIEFYSKPSTANWLIGEETGNTIRSMSNPNQFGDPNCYQGTDWYTGTGDNGGVHINSGVQNHWFYILTNGKTGVNDLGNAYSVSALGITKAAEIAFRNLTVYLSASSNYSDARAFAIQSAIDLYGACSFEVTQVANAWHAVGVGAAYTPTVNADFAASQTSACQAPLNVVFTNNSSHGTSYLWDFGDGTTSTMATPTHVYQNNGTYTVTLITDGGACGMDTLVMPNYIQIDPSKPCVTTMVRNGVTAKQTSCSGVIFDSGGNGAYENDTRDEITIAPVGAGKITLTFDEFDVEAGLGNNCNYDVLTIYDGASANASIIGQFCNNQPPGSTLVINNPQGAVTLVFESDDLVTRQGFKITYQCEQSTVAPNAEFEADVDSTCVGDIAFADLSTYGPTSWEWDFGDGTTSTLQNPVHKYTSNGTYTVRLKATNANGNDTEVKNALIHVGLISNNGISVNAGINGQSDTLISINPPGVSYWYDDLSQSYLDTGDMYVVPPALANSTVYLIQESALTSVYGARYDNLSGGGNMFNNVQGLIFDVYQNSVLESVKVYAGAAGTRVIELQDFTGAVIESKTVNIPDGESRVTLDFPIPAGVNYNLTVNGNATINLFRNNSGVSYPYNVGNIAQIKRSTANQNPFGFYYFFYDWQMQDAPCLSEADSVQLTTSVDELTLNSRVQLYPNPAHNTVMIAAKDQQAVSVVITNVAGQTMFTSATRMNQQEIDVQSWASGVYFVQVTGNDFQETTKLMVE